MRSEKVFYSKQEFAELIGISVHTVTRDVRLGRIDARRYGRRLLIPAAELTRIASEGMKPMEHAAS
jgi:excisionase family DNA binding protein